VLSYPLLLPTAKLRLTRSTVEKGTFLPIIHAASSSRGRVLGWIEFEEMHAGSGPRGCNSEPERWASGSKGMEGVEAVGIVFGLDKRDMTG
jgi:hypothetical protein